MIDVVGENKLKKIDIYKNGVFYQRFIPDSKKFKKN